MTEKMIKGLDSLDRAKDVAFSPVQSTALPEETLTVTEEEEAWNAGRMPMVAEYYEDAIPALLAYINKPAYPHQLKARIYLGEAYYWLNRFDKAAEVLSDALAMNNNNPNAQYLLALSKFQQGKVTEANKWADLAATQHPNNVNCVWAAARIKSWQYDWRAAARYYRQTIDLHKRPDRIAIDLQRLNPALHETLVKVLSRLAEVTDERKQAALEELEALVYGELFGRNAGQQYYLKSLDATLNGMEVFSYYYVLYVKKHPAIYYFLQEYGLADLHE